MGNLSNLTHLYLYDNILTGKIPTEPGKLYNLRALLLDNNRVTGAIPMELENPTKLRQVYLEVQRAYWLHPGGPAGVDDNDLRLLGLRRSLVAVLLVGAPGEASNRKSPQGNRGGCRASV